MTSCVTSEQNHEQRKDVCVAIGTVRYQMSHSSTSTAHTMTFPACRTAIASTCTRSSLLGGRRTVHYLMNSLRCRCDTLFWWELGSLDTRNL